MLTKISHSPSGCIPMIFQVILLLYWKLIKPILFPSKIDCNKLNQFNTKYSNESALHCAEVVAQTFLQRRQNFAVDRLDIAERLTDANISI